MTKAVHEAMGGYIFKTDIDIAMEEGRDEMADALNYWSEQGHDEEIRSALKDKSIRKKILEEYRKYCLTQAATA